MPATPTARRGVSPLLRSVVAAALGVAAVMGVAACSATAETASASASGDDFPVSEARTVTTAEAELLATARFHNYDAGTRAVSFAVTSSTGQMSFSGWFDFVTGTGYGQVSDGRLILWNADALGTHAAVTASGSASASGTASAPLPIPDADQLATAWSGGSLDASASSMQAVLAVIVNLGSDRAENPLLLQQTGALWLGSRELDGAHVTVFAGPSSDDASSASADPAAATVRYWVDDSGMMHRVDVRLGGGDAWTSIRFGDATGVDLGDPFGDAASAGASE